MIVTEIAVWQAIVLGIVQGLTEFLPISSSAHLIIVPWLFGWSEPGLTFDVALHIGTFVAVLLYFWSDLLGMAGDVWTGIRSGAPLKLPGSRLALFIIIGSIPGAIAGFLGDTAVEELFHTPGSQRQAMVVIALVMILLGLILALAEVLARHVRSLHELTWRDAAIVGLAQMFALIPGVSRSGSTITAGLFVNLKRDAAARFSFLLALPITAGAALKKMLDLVRHNQLASGDRLAFVAGILTAAIVGYLCIKFLLGYLQRHTTRAFTIYRVAIGLLILLLVVVRG